jgi:hypothetical protein
MDLEILWFSQIYMKGKALSIYFIFRVVLEAGMQA